MNNKKSTILLIEDNPLLSDAYRKGLTEKDFMVHVACAGEEGVEVAKKVHPDLVLLDLRIHGLLGLDVLQVIKGDPDTAAAHVIVFTMSADEKDREQALAFGADNFFRKSEINMADLIAHIESILDK